MRQTTSACWGGPRKLPALTLPARISGRSQSKMSFQRKIAMAGKPTWWLGSQKDIMIIYWSMELIRKLFHHSHLWGLLYFKKIVVIGMIYAWIWVPQPFRCIIRKKWFPVESSSKPPLSEIPKPCKCVFQSRTASSFWTCSSVLFPIQERSPGRLNSVVMMRIVSDGSMSLSSDAIRRANIPNIWSSLSCAWLFLRKAKAESLIFLLETNADIYVKLIWFFNSLTVLSPHTTRRVGTPRPLLWQISCTRSSPRAMISVTQLESCLVHSSMTWISSEKPPVVQWLVKIMILAFKCGLNRIISPKL